MAKKNPKRPAAKHRTATQPKIEMRCFIACDYAGRVEVEPKTGHKTSLQGMFDTVWVEKVPAVYGQFFIFIQLKGGVGKTDLVVTGRNADGDEFMVMTAKGLILQAGKRAEIIAKVPALPIGVLGDIQFVVTIGSQPIGWPLTLHVKKTKKP
jgi:hypothetical protein